MSIVGGLEIVPIGLKSIAEETEENRIERKPKEWVWKYISTCGVINRCQKNNK